MEMRWNENINKCPKYGNENVVALARFGVLRVYLLHSWFVHSFVKRGFVVFDVKENDWKSKKTMQSITKTNQCVFFR